MYAARERFGAPVQRACETAGHKDPPRPSLQLLPATLRPGQLALSLVCSLHARQHASHGKVSQADQDATPDGGGERPLALSAAKPSVSVSLTSQTVLK